MSTQDEMLDEISSDLFDASSAEDTAAPAEPAPPVASEPAAAPIAQPSDATLAALNVPDSWRKEVHDHWATLPRAVQEEIHRREADMFKGIESYRQRAGIADRFGEILKPYESLISQYQVDPLQLVNNFFAAHHRLSFGTPEEKQALFHRLAEDYGINLSGQPAEPQFIDPQVADLQSKLGQLQSWQMQQEQAEAARRTEEASRQVQAFAADPANIYFQDLHGDMVRLIQQGTARTLQDAYQQAMWLNPAVREKELSRQLEERKAADAAKAAQAAKATSANLRTSPKNRSSATPSGSMDDTIREAYADILARS